MKCFSGSYLPTYYLVSDYQQWTQPNWFLTKSKKHKIFLAIVATDWPAIGRKSKTCDKSFKKLSISFIATITTDFIIFIVHTNTIPPPSSSLSSKRAYFIFKLVIIKRLSITTDRPIAWYKNADSICLWMQSNHFCKIKSRIKIRIDWKLFLWFGERQTK